MLLSRYSLKIFITRPISLILLLCIIIAFAWGPIKQMIQKKRAAAR
jgi:F0F1-type ATP synthase membrane subunit b/b'